MTTYTINKRFATHVERSERVLEIAEAFGLGLDDKEFVVYDNLKLDIEPGDVVYITGESGSGKSTILRELAAQMSEKGMRVADIDKVEFKDCPLADQIGANLNDALRLMSMAGITDANLFVRKPSELSDGQRYRFRLAKVIESGAQVWTADEFLAVLDRETAKVIAYSMQNVARANKATFMVATTHTDMVPDLAPSLVITKKYREKVHVAMPYSREGKMNDS